jgi:hypothetical protein
MTPVQGLVHSLRLGGILVGFAFLAVTQQR